MSKLSEQQEKFCRHVVEGLCQYEAYIAAGYADTEAAHANASRLIRKDKIANRIAELRESATESAEITLEWLIAESVDLYRQAKTKGSHAAANATLKTVGVYTGLWNEKSTRENLNRYAEDFTEEELAAIASGGGTRAADETDSPAKPPIVH